MLKEQLKKFLEQIKVSKPEDSDVGFRATEKIISELQRLNQEIETIRAEKSELLRKVEVLNQDTDVKKTNQGYKQAVEAIKEVSRQDNETLEERWPPPDISSNAYAKGVIVATGKKPRSSKNQDWVNYFDGKTIDEFRVSRKNPEICSIFNDRQLIPYAIKYMKEHGFISIDSKPHRRSLQNTTMNIMQENIFKVEEYNESYEDNFADYKGRYIEPEACRTFNRSNNYLSNRSFPITVEEIDAIVKKYNLGMSDQELQDFFQRKIDAIHKILNNKEASQLTAPDPSMETKLENWEKQESKKNFKKDEVGIKDTHKTSSEMQTGKLSNQLIRAFDTAVDISESNGLTEQTFDEEKPDDDRIKKNLNDLGEIFKQDDPIIPDEKRFLREEIILLLVEFRPTNKKKILRVLATKGLRRTIDDTEWENRIYDVIEVLSDSAPEILQESEEKLKTIGISNDEAKRQLIELRDEYHQHFPNSDAANILLKDNLLDFYVNHPPFTEDEYHFRGYFLSKLNTDSRDHIFKSITEAGYTIELALIPLMENAHAVIMLVDYD
jgi:hypothetical protein